MVAEEAGGAPTQAANSGPEEPDEPCAWQPFTPGGVAAFAQASFLRLFVFQVAMAALVAAAIAWFVGANYYPQITAAVKQLPAEGEIRKGELHWGGRAPQVLAEHRLLAISIDPEHSGQARAPAHVLVEFGRQSVLLISIFGAFTLPYPEGVVVAFNQPEVEPWWGAWAPPGLALLVLGSMAGLLISWALLALLYAGPICLLAFFANRTAGFGIGWRLAGAAMLPGAALLGCLIVLYGLGSLNLLELLAGWGIHFLVGWLYMAGGIYCLPQISGVSVKGNPFAGNL